MNVQKIEHVKCSCLLWEGHLFKKAYKMLETAETIFGKAQWSPHWSGSGLVESESVLLHYPAICLGDDFVQFSQMKSIWLWFCCFFLHKSKMFWGIFQVKLRRQMVSVGTMACQKWTFKALILMEAPPVVKSIESHFYLPNVEWLSHCPEKWLHFCNTSIKEGK